MKFLQPVLSFTIVVLLLTACEHLPMEEDLALHYATSSETSYTDIKIEQGQLAYTYFEDTDNRCAQWFKSTPCWTQADLKTVTAPLDVETETALRHWISEQKRPEAAPPIELQAAQAPSSLERAYSEKLTIRLGQHEQQLVYLSRPDAPPKPESFQQIEQLLHTAAEKLKTPAN